MRSVSRFVHLPATERSLLFRIVVLLSAIQVALLVMPLSELRRRLTGRLFGAVFPADLVNVDVERLEWAVRAAARRIPKAACLAQSLALQFLLARRGRASIICIGVAKDEARKFLAHAWVNCAGEVLLSRPEEVAGYTVLATFEPL